MTTTLQIRVEGEIAICFKALAKRMKITQGQTVAEMVAMMSAKLDAEPKAETVTEALV